MTYEEFRDYLLARGATPQQIYVLEHALAGEDGVALLLQQHLVANEEEAIAHFALKRARFVADIEQRGIDGDRLTALNQFL